VMCDPATIPHGSSTATPLASRISCATETVTGNEAAAATDGDGEGEEDGEAEVEWVRRCARWGRAAAKAEASMVEADGGDREGEGGLVRAERGGWTAAAASSSRGWGWGRGPPPPRAREGGGVGAGGLEWIAPGWLMVRLRLRGWGVRKRVCGPGSDMGRVGPKQYPTGIKSGLMTWLMTRLL
jgi:hypothetical protein